MSSLNEKAKETSNVWNKAGKVFSKCCDEISKISKVSKFKLTHTRLQKERNDTFRHLGEETYRLIKEGKFESSQVQNIVQCLDALTERVDHHHKEISRAAQGTENTPPPPNNPSV